MGDDAPGTGAADSAASESGIQLSPFDREVLFRVTSMGARWLFWWDSALGAHGVRRPSIHHGWEHTLYLLVHPDDRLRIWPVLQAVAASRTAVKDTSTWLRRPPALRLETKWGNETETIANAADAIIEPESGRYASVRLHVRFGIGHRPWCPAFDEVAATAVITADGPAAGIEPLLAVYSANEGRQGADGYRTMAELDAGLRAREREAADASMYWDAVRAGTESGPDTSELHQEQPFLWLQALQHGCLCAVRGLHLVSQGGPAAAAAITEMLASVDPTVALAHPVIADVVHNIGRAHAQLERESPNLDVVEDALMDATGICFSQRGPIGTRSDRDRFVWTLIDAINRATEAGRAGPDHLRGALEVLRMTALGLRTTPSASSAAAFLGRLADRLGDLADLARTAHDSTHARLTDHWVDVARAALGGVVILRGEERFDRETAARLLPLASDALDAFMALPERDYGDIAARGIAVIMRAIADTVVDVEGRGWEDPFGTFGPAWPYVVVADAADNAGSALRSRYSTIRQQRNHDLAIAATQAPPSEREPGL